MNVFWPRFVGVSMSKGWSPAEQTARHSQVVRPAGIYVCMRLVRGEGCVHVACPPAMPGTVGGLTAEDAGVAACRGMSTQQRASHQRYARESREYSGRL